MFEILNIYLFMIFFVVHALPRTWGKASNKLNLAHHYAKRARILYYKICGKS